jgi:hypothetical protein
VYLNLYIFLTTNWKTKYSAPTVLKCSNLFHPKFMVHKIKYTGRN